jgi:hypothetical protein
MLLAGVIVGVVVRGVGVVEKPWSVRKVVGVLVGRAIGIARTGDRTGVRGCGSREIVRLLIVTDIAEVLRLAKVVRRFAGRLVRIGSSVPTHAGAVPRAEGPCRL